MAVNIVAVAATGSGYGKLIVSASSVIVGLYPHDKRVRRISAGRASQYI